MTIEEALAVALKERDELITHAWDAIIAHRRPKSTVLAPMPALMELAEAIHRMTGRYPCSMDPSFTAPGVCPTCDSKDPEVRQMVSYGGSDVRCLSDFHKGSL